MSVKTQPESRRVRTFESELPWVAELFQSFPEFNETRVRAKQSDKHTKCKKKKKSVPYINKKGFIFTYLGARPLSLSACISSSVSTHPVLLIHNSVCETLGKPRERCDVVYLSRDSDIKRKSSSLLSSPEANGERLRPTETKEEAQQK